MIGTGSSLYRTARERAGRVARRVGAREVPILPAGYGERLQVLKPAGEEPVRFVPVFGLRAGGALPMSYPEIALRRFSNASVFATSDFILVDGGAVWDKYHFPQFTKTSPLDRDLAEAGDGRLRLRGIGRARPRAPVAAGFSLCGAQSRTWSHFLVQYLPKLTAVDAALEAAGGALTLIVPRYTDANVREIVTDFVAARPGLELLELEVGERVECAALFHVPNTAYLADHADYLSIYDIVIPEMALPSLAAVAARDEEPLPHGAGEKLYLARRGQRTLAEVEKVEALFVARGYRIIEPAALSLAEKRQMFGTAAAVVGPLSSGFTNLIFCRPGTRALVFSNLQRSFDSYLGFIAAGFGIDISIVTGHDHASDPHTSYSITLERIAAAADQAGV